MWAHARPPSLFRCLTQSCTQLVYWASGGDGNLPLVTFVCGDCGRGEVYLVNVLLIVSCSQVPCAVCPSVALLFGVMKILLQTPALPWGEKRERIT